MTSEEHSPSDTEVFDLRELVEMLPDGWRDIELFSVVYQAFEIPRASLPEPVVLELSDVCAILVYGSVRYQATRSVRLEQTSDALGLSMKFDVDGVSESPHGPLLALFTAFDAEPLARERIDTASGLMVSFQGRAIAYEKLFETSMSPTSMSLYTPSIENPGMHGRPNLRPDYFAFIETARAVLVALPSENRNRIELALRWINAAVRDRGVDAFLKYWMGVETLAMPNTTNIRPINESLARGYGLGIDQVRDEFLVGRLYGRRNEIVHNGDMRPVDARVLMYLLALFIDLLREALGIVAARRAKTLLADPDFSDFTGLL